MPAATAQKRAGPSLRRILVWPLILASAFAVLQLLARGGPGRTEIAYTDLTRELDSGNLAQVALVVQDHRLEGEFRRSVMVGGAPVVRFTVNLPFEDPAPLVQRLESHGVPIRAAAPGTPWIQVLLSTIPWLLLGAFWFFILRQTRRGGESALAFGRMDARRLTGEEPKVTFADVAGTEEAKTELREIIQYLKEPGRFQRIGGRMPKGVLLVGPPGTGKTLLARAVAGEAGVPFFSISGSDFVELFVGVGASRVRSLFAQGKANAPCIIFIDELDAVGRLRGVGLAGIHEEREQTLNQLLVELDGFSPAAGVIVLSATNRPDVLDPALLRPGRFDRQIVVDLPDVRAREHILRVHTRDVVLSADADLAVIARSAPGYSGADLANLINEAALLAARRGSDQVQQRDLEDARDKITLGIERRSLVLTQEERRLTAFHEAGHALVTALTPGLDPVQKVSIVPRGSALGVTAAWAEADRRTHTRAYLMGRLTAAYGGRAAEELVFGPDQITTGAALDFQQATELARRMVTEFGMSDAVGPLTVTERLDMAVVHGAAIQSRAVSERTAELVDEEVRKLVKECYARARQVLRAHRATLDALAAALLERETLSRADVEQIVAAAPAPAAPPAEQAPVRLVPGAGLRAG